MLRKLAVPPEQALFFLELATAAPVLDYFPTSPVLYDCVDDMRRWHGNSAAMSGHYTRLEEEVAQRASWIVVSSPRLVNRFARCTAELIEGLNGVDAAFFLDSSQAPPTAPPDLAGLPRPWLLYVGMLGAYVDATLLRVLAEADLGSIVLVGPLDPRAPVARLRGHPDITLLGARQYEELPNYVKVAAVGLIPATRTAAGDCIPAKLFQYCAAGLPVVARHCSSLAPYSDCLLLADTNAEFLASVRRALEDPHSGREARVALARECTWDRLGDRLLERMGIL